MATDKIKEENEVAETASEEIETAKAEETAEIPAEDIEESAEAEAADYEDEASVAETKEAEEPAEAEEENEDAAGAEESEEAKETAEAEEAEEAADEDEKPETPVRKESSKRLKKAARREAKAARKAANKLEEKKSRPNNLLIALLIFGVVVGMFAFVLGYNYLSKPANIAKYLEENGGEEQYGNIQLDAYTTANITAEGNSMNIDITSATDDEDIASQLRDYYGGDSGKEQLEYLAAYFLTTIKPQTRAFSADAKVTVTLNGEELNSIEMTFKEAEELMNKDEEDTDTADDAEEAEDTADDAGDAAEDTADDAENAADTADDAGDAADTAADAADDASGETEGE